jgi:hypothetical protein
VSYSYDRRVVSGLLSLKATLSWFGEPTRDLDPLLDERERGRRLGEARRIESSHRGWRPARIG